MTGDSTTDRGSDDEQETGSLSRPGAARLPRRARRRRVRADGDTGARERRLEHGRFAERGRDGRAVQLGFDEGFTGFMALDASLVDHGIQMALEQVDDQVLGRPIEYIKADNASDPVSGRRQGAAAGGERQDRRHARRRCSRHRTPQSPTTWRARRRHPVDLVHGPADRQHEDRQRAVVHPDRLLQHARVLPRQVRAEDAGYKTANVIVFEDTASRQHGRAATRRAFTEGGGKILTEKYVPYDTMDFAPYLTTMPEGGLHGVLDLRQRLRAVHQGVPRVRFAGAAPRPPSELPHRAAVAGPGRLHARHQGRRVLREHTSTTRSTGSSSRTTVRSGTASTPTSTPGADGSPSTCFSRV